MSRLAWALLGLALALAGCAGPQPTTVPPAPTNPALVPFAPQWIPGSRWVWDWKSGTESGTKTLDVVEVKEVNQVSYYVVRIGDLEHYFTLDLRWAAAVHTNKVVSRMVPPQPWFTWPLEVGRRWTHEGTFEEGTTKRAESERFSVVAFEAIQVPAGRLDAFKVVREAGNGDGDEYWYAPKARFYARWIGRRGPVQFEEQLREYPGGPPPPSRVPTRQ